MLLDSREPQNSLLQVPRQAVECHLQQSVPGVLQNHLLSCGQLAHLLVRPGTLRYLWQQRASESRILQRGSLISSISTTGGNLQTVQICRSHSGLLNMERGAWPAECAQTLRGLCTHAADRLTGGLRDP